MILTGNLNEIEQAFTNAIGAAFTLAIIIWIIKIVLLVAVVALITWVVRNVWDSTGNRNQKRRNRKWEKAQKKRLKDQKRIEENNYQRTNQKIDSHALETNKKFENNPDWIWDDENQMWRHKKYWNKENQGKD